MRSQSSMRKWTKEELDDAAELEGKMTLWAVVIAVVGTAGYFILKFAYNTYLIVDRMTTQ